MTNQRRTAMLSSYLKKILFINCLIIAQAHAIDKLRLEQRSGLFSGIEDSVPVVTAQYIAWDANWKWSGVNIAREALAKDNNANLVYHGKVAALDTDFTATIKVDGGQIQWDYAFDNKKDHPEAIGFGIEFNLIINSATFKTPAQAPELLPGNQGWRWQTPGGQALEVKFSPAIAKINFERNQKDKIRAFFFAPVHKGSEQIRMTVTVSGEKVRIIEPMANEPAQDNDKTWQRNILSEKVSPIDLAFLNKEHIPAGKHGAVKAQGDKLIFEDGTPAKFWGANLMAYALFNTSDVEIKTHAKRMARLGFNLMRIHHHDSNWVTHNIFKNQADNTQELSADAFKKLDWWIKCLKENGIYVWLDLHVGRKVTQKDGIDHFNDFAKGKNAAEIKGFNYYNESIQQQMQKFNEAYLNHVNPFTKLPYKTDPAVIALLITNENDLSLHYGNNLLPDKNVPVHNELFSKDVKQFTTANGLAYDKAWHTWEMGDAKIYLADAEHRFNQKMTSHLRSFGVKPMIVPTNFWGGMGLYSLPSLMDGNLIDTHAYGKAEELTYNPRYNPGFLSWIGAAQVTGKPLSSTEWNLEPFPVPDRHTMLAYTAAIAGLQGWDAMMLYGYSQAPLDGYSQSNNYSTYNDPAIMGVMPTAALLFRDNHVSQAKQHYEMKLSRDDFFFKKQDPSTSKTIRTLLETSRFTVTVPEIAELPWLKNPVAKSNPATPVSDPDHDFIPTGQNFVESDTGELKRDWEKGIQTIDTVKSQVAAGNIGGEPIQLKNVTINISTKNAFAAAQSLDDEPLKSSKTIFITLMARSMPDKDKRSFLSEPVSGSLEISARQGLKLYPINSRGEKDKAIEVNYEKGRYKLNFDQNNRYHWFLLTSEKRG
jgi:hypothetical protein